MPPLPNTDISSAEPTATNSKDEREVTHLQKQVLIPNSKSVDSIKNLLTENSLVTLKPYEDGPKDWETCITKGSCNVTEKIEHFEKRIQILIVENLQTTPNKAKQVESIGSESLNPPIGSEELVEPPSLQNEQTKIEDTVSESVPTVLKLEMNGNYMNGHMNGIHKAKTSWTWTPEVHEVHEEGLEKRTTKFVSLYLHLTAIFGLYLILSGQVLSGLTIIWGFGISLSLIGVYIWTNPSTDFLYTGSWKIMLGFFHPQLLLKNLNSDNQISDLEYGKQEDGSTLKKRWIWLLLPFTMSIIPWLFWGESFLNSYLIAGHLAQWISHHVIVYFTKGYSNAIKYD